MKEEAALEAFGWLVRRRICNGWMVGEGNGREHNTDCVMSPRLWGHPPVRPAGLFDPLRASNGCRHGALQALRCTARARWHSSCALPAPVVVLAWRLSCQGFVTLVPLLQIPLHAWDRLHPALRHIVCVGYLPRSVVRCWVSRAAVAVSCQPPVAPLEVLNVLVAVLFVTGHSDATRVRVSDRAHACCMWGCVLRISAL